MIIKLISISLNNFKGIEHFQQESSSKSEVMLLCRLKQSMTVTNLSGS